MKKQFELPLNGLCVILCMGLIIATLFGSDFLSGVALNIADECVQIRKELITDIPVMADSSSEEKKVFSPVGFGGGYRTTSVSDTPADILELMEKAENLYKTFEKTGDIKEEQFCTSLTGDSYGNININNRTGKNTNIKELINTTPSYGKITKQKPYILIYHTHTTEGYELLDKGWYSNDYNSRTKDKNKNMVRVGEALKEAIEDCGFEVVHDKTIYDTAYTGAYDRSRKAVEKHLKENPSIVMTLDVHRDAIHYDGKVKSKPTALIDGKKAAQVMIITGCEGSGVESFEDWQKNLVFSVHLQNSVEERYAGLMRPILFSYRKYNMDITPCSVLLEFGTDANTIEEAVYSGTLIGKSIGKMLEEQLKGE